MSDMKLSLSAIFVALAILLTSSAGVAGSSDDVHFLLIDSNLHLFAADSQVLREECNRLQLYVDHHSRRNKRPFSVQASRCDRQREFSFADEIGRVVFPVYSDTERVKEKVAARRGFVTSIGQWFPVEIWTRYADKPQDGVCYNTTLVESGILTEAFRSSFLTSIEYFLGMRGAVEASVDRSKIKMIFGAISASPLIKARRTWEVDGVSKESIRVESRDFIREHFSPGSVLCVSVDDRQTKEELRGFVARTAEEIAAKSSTNLNVESNVHDLPDDYISEGRGGHCLVFLTENLISESNLRLPKNLMSWDLAFDFYYDLIGQLGGKGRFHYMQIDSSAVSRGEWADREISTSPRMVKLAELARKHRLLYERVPWRHCRNTSRIDLYSPTCKETNLEALALLREFWLTEGALLDHHDFSDYRNKLRHQSSYLNYRSDIDNVAFDLFSSMWELRLKLTAHE